MLRPSPVPQFVVGNQGTRSISPLNIQSNQQNVPLQSKNRTSSFSQIQPTNNPLSSLQNQAYQQKPIISQINTSNENRMTRNSSDIHAFFSTQNHQSQQDIYQRLSATHSASSIKCPPPPLPHMSTQCENQQILQENRGNQSTKKGNNSPRHHPILSEGKHNRILQSSQSSNILLSHQNQQNITKIVTTPSGMHANAPLHAKRDSFIPTPSSSSSSFHSLNNIKEDENQKNSESSLNKMTGQKNEQSQLKCKTNIPVPLQSQENMSMIKKHRSNSHLGVYSPSKALPTFSSDPINQCTIDTPQSSQINAQQKQLPTLIKNKSTSIICSDGTLNSQEGGTVTSQAGTIYSSHTPSERCSFNQTQPLPPTLTQMKLNQQVQSDKQTLLVHDLQQKILILLNENEKVNSVLRQKQVQISQLVTQMNQSKDSNEEIRKQLEAQTLQIIEISQNLKNSQNKEQDYQKDNQQLQDNLKQMGKDLDYRDSLQTQIQREMQENEEKYKRIIEEKQLNYKELLTEMEDKISMLVDENNKLNEIISIKMMKESSVSSSQPHSEELIQQIQMLIQENQKLEQIITTIESQQNELAIRYDEKEKNYDQLNQEQSNLIKTNEELKNKIIGFENKVKAVFDENDKLQQKTKDYDRLVLDSKKVLELKSENEILLENLKSVTKDKQKVQFQSQQQDEIFQEQQSHLLEQCAQLQKKLEEERKLFEQKQEEFMKEKEDLLSQFDKFKEENTTLAKQISEIEEKIESLIVENQDLSNVVSSQREHIESLEKRQESYTEELKKQFDSSLRQKIEENLIQLTNRYNEEINKLHNEIIKRNENITEENMKNNQLLEQVTCLKEELNKLNGELNKVNDELKELREFSDLEDEQKYGMQKEYQQQLEFENNELKNKIESLESDKQCVTQQVEELINDQNNRDQLIEEYQQQIFNSEFSEGNNNKQIKQLIQSQNELIESNLMKDKENKELMELIQQTKQEFDITIQQYQQLLDENNDLKQEIRNNPNPNDQVIASLHQDLELTKKERDELLLLKKKQQIELSKKNKELIERREELDHLQLKLEQSFSNGSYHQVASQFTSQQHHNQQMLQNNQSQKLNTSQSQYSNNSNAQQKTIFRN